MNGTNYEVTSTPTRPVDNVVIATKGLQDRNTNIIAGTTVENKGKLILIENDAHGIEKLLLKTQVSLTSFLHSEVNILIQIITIFVGA